MRKKQPAHHCDHCLRKAKHGKCEVTLMEVTAQTIQICTLAGWKTVRYAKDYTRRKRPHYPPVE